MPEKPVLSSPNGKQRQVDPASEALDDPQTLDDRDQTLSDAGQTLSDTDQTAADSDQAAADFDQEASDRDLAHGGDRVVHDVTRDIRDRSTAQRDENARGRVAAAAARDSVATARDLTASARDHAAALLDSRLAAEEAGAGAGDGRATGAEIVLRAAENRKAAAAARASAGEGRARAAADRDDAARDREQARLDREALLAQLAIAETDALTGVRMRAAGLRALNHEIDRARRTLGLLAVAYVDVVGLKTVNDTRGHSAGDAVLQRAVVAIRGHLRSYDLIVRLGGDEFLCVMSGATIDDARQRFHGVQATLGTGDDPFEIKVGFAALTPEDTAAGVIERADAELSVSHRR
jgi:diguanylate cyclase (GGDEF)-like protein